MDIMPSCVIGSAKEAVQFILNQKMEETIKIAVLMWNWWSKRNNVRETWPENHG
jgi:hypothetical protein